MKTTLFVSSLLICTLTFSNISLSFQQVDLNKINVAVSEANIDVYETTSDAAPVHHVWLYTEADCERIKWRLGANTHSKSLSCGRTAAFMSVPSGIHYTVIEGCGKRIGAYLTVEEDLHLMIQASDLDTKAYCEAKDRSEESPTRDVESLKSLMPTSLISEL